MEIKYNSQRDNDSFGGKFPGWKQCFSTCSFMFLSYYCADIDGDDDSKLAMYLDDVEVAVGHEGIAEEVFKQQGPSSFWWYVQAAGIQKWLNERMIAGNVKFANCTASFSELKELVKNGPVILGTDKLGGLSGGHIILAVDSTIDGLIIKDPYGDANTNYEDHNGDCVIYEDSFLLPHVVYGKPDKVRCIYLEA